MGKYVGRIYTKEDLEKLGYQNEYIRVKASEDDFWDYLPLISVVVSAFSLVLSVVVWLFKVL